jgi:hypothetical protein
MQLDYVATLINALLEGWRVSHLFLKDADFVPSRHAPSCLASGNQGGGRLRTATILKKEHNS